MADNKGMIYENKINKLLKDNGIQKKNFQGAGSDSNAPDAEITIGGVDYKVEVKLDLKVDFGQGSLDYDLKKDKWILSGAPTASGQAMRDFLEKVGVPKLVNKAWGPKGPPRKFTVPLKNFTKADVDYDYKNFKDTFVNVPSDAISDYYASKKTYYIQIGKFGLYYMGKDVAKLGVPEFKPQIRLRIRLKRGGSFPIYNYRFSTALQVKSLPKSNMDLEDKDTLQTLKARSKKK
jgi:hypothetical protein